ncbi:MAG: hypothetical protein RIS47_1397 [Bacteroidota bacterium]
MSNFKPPKAKNEPVLDYKPGSAERTAIQQKLAEMRATQIEAPMYIGGKMVTTGNLVAMRPPHDHAHILGHFHRGDASHVSMAIDAALVAKEKWMNVPWQHKAAIFLKAADLIAGKYRATINAATMLGQSKSVNQAEIDSACELTDFLRHNVQYMYEIYSQQPANSAGIWNRLEQRPLEGFVFALTPFNFTAIAGNLPSAPAMMGNVVVWKPSNTQIYAAKVIMDIFIEAGLPAGVINLIYVSGPVAGDIIFQHPDFAGIHFTGSTGVFQDVWKTIGQNIHKYKTYPRIVGETGGKDFVMVHPTADTKAVIAGLVRGAFEFQGQKCSAASRAYIPQSLWPTIKDGITAMIADIKMGGTEDLSNFFNAVIDEASFNKIERYILAAKASHEAEVIIGGNCDKSVGYFIEPTVILTSNPHYITMEEEIFGPVLTIYVYPDAEFEQTLDLVDKTSIYALTGAIFSQDRESIVLAERKLVNAAGNFYINDKPTGAVVGQQPFGGARGSGTNDKAGGLINLLRWVSPRTIKETFQPVYDYKYPFLETE